MDYVELPEKSRDHTILELRDFSRKLVRELGFMRNTLADSDLAPSAVHAVIEIGLAPGLQARDLADTLRLDKSNTSRQLAKLESLGLLLVVRLSVISFQFRRRSEDLPPVSENRSLPLETCN